MELLNPFNEKLMRFFLSFTGLLPQLFLVIGSIYYINKKGFQADSILLLARTIIVPLTSIAFNRIQLVSMETMEMQNISMLFSITNRISSLGSILFTI